MLCSFLPLEAEAARRYSSDDLAEFKLLELGGVMTMSFLFKSPVPVTARAPTPCSDTFDYYYYE